MKTKTINKPKKEIKNKEVDIEFDDVTKVYYLCNNDFQRLMLLLFPFKRKQKAKVALDHVSFKIHRGEKVALIGSNGAGKSTILYSIVGSSIPSTGSIKVNRRVSTLIDVLSGLEEDFTGKENIYIKGNILGYSKKEINQVFDQIVEFAEIGPYINQELKRYSYGMKARLGFSINIHLFPQILLIDEALSVGDEAFNLKAKQTLTKICKQDDTTVLIISHNDTTIKNLCDRGIYLKEGKIIYDGKLNQALKRYHQDNKIKK